MSIELRSLKKTYDRFSIDLDLTIPDDETLVLAGPSGCGKTTALCMIAGLVAPDSGSILLDGKNVQGIPTWKRGIGIVFQDLALFPHLSVGGNVAYGPFVRGIPRRERASIVETCLRSARLEGYAKRRVDTLSGGERQRTAIARALAASPRALLMDEPFSSLDAPLRRELRAEFRELRDRSDYPCIFVTHDREEAAALGDRMAIMREGRIAELGPPRDLFLTPRTAFAARFLGAGTVLEAELIGISNGKVSIRSALGISAISSGERESSEIRTILVPRDAIDIVGADSKLALCKAVVRSAVFSGERETLSVELPDRTMLTIDSPPRTEAPSRNQTIGLAVNESRLRFLEA